MKQQLAMSNAKGLTEKGLMPISVAWLGGAFLAQADQSDMWRPTLYAFDNITYMTYYLI